MAAQGVARNVQCLCMKTFVQVAEVRVPSADGREHELSAGLFDGAPAFGEISRTMRFVCGEALPGRARGEGRPLLLPRLEGSYFKRTADLKLADGYFGATDPALEALTRDGSPSRGAGAPGLA